MLPSVVNDGAMAFWALSAEMLAPPVAAVTVTAACVTLAAPTASPDTTKSIASLFFMFWDKSTMFRNDMMHVGHQSCD